MRSMPMQAILFISGSLMPSIPGRTKVIPAVIIMAMIPSITAVRRAYDHTFLTPR